MGKGCAWCGMIEKYNGDNDPLQDYIRGSCVQLLLKFSRDELKAGYDLAMSKGYAGKAAVLKMFLNSEEKEAIGGKLPARIERRFDRGRINRVPRNQKERIGRLPDERSPVLSAV